jgi:hypothetical protein
MAKISTKARVARETRWLYRVEWKILNLNREAVKDRKIGYLRTLAQEVWANEAPGGRTMPTILASKGIKYSRGWYSYCEGFTKIVLSRRQRSIMVLLHELTHALGPCIHGKRFVTLYFYLLHKYAGYNRFFLQHLQENSPAK